MFSAVLMATGGRGKANMTKLPLMSEHEGVEDTRGRLGSLEQI